MIAGQRDDLRLLLKRRDDNSLSADRGARTNATSIWSLSNLVTTSLLSPSSSTSDTMGKASRNAWIGFGTIGLKGAVGAMPTQRLRCSPRAARRVISSARSKRASMPLASGSNARCPLIGAMRSSLSQISRNSWLPSSHYPAVHFFEHCRERICVALRRCSPFAGLCNLGDTRSPPTQSRFNIVRAH